MDFARSNNIDDVGIPEDLRCKRSDGKQWRCSALSMPDKTVCEKHYIQAKKRAANSALRASMKKAKRKPVDEGDSYLDSKDEVDLSLMNTKGGESPVQMKKYKEKIPKNQPYSPETVTMRGLSRNHQKSTVDSQRDVPHIDENRPKSAYRTPPSAGSFRYKTQNSNGTTHGDLSSKSSDYSGEIGGLTCHQCQRDDRETVIWCLRCDKKGYCDVCISKWYPDIHLDEIRRACPACCGACNCKACFRPDSLIKARIREIAARDKLQYLHSLLSLVLPVLKKIHSEQSFELELETRTQGTKTDIPRAKLHPDEQMCCDCCKVPIIDYHRHCSSCMYDLCLTCCRDLRQTTQEDKRSHDGHSPTNNTKSTTPMEQTVMIDPSHMFPDWKANSDGSIPCPPKESGGCGCQSLSLRRIFKMNWVAKLVKNAEEMVNGCKVSGVGGVWTCLSCSWSTSSESSGLVDSKLVKASHREDSSDNYLYSPMSQDIKMDGICHFRKHWHKGEPIAVKGMADFMLTSSWDPMVLWRGIQEISEENVTENNYILKAVDCLDWSDVDIEVGQYVEGYFEGRIHDDGWPEMLKLKDWPRPSALEEFLYYQRPEFLSNLPLLEYIHSKWGFLNLAAKLPHDSLQADVGPKLFIAYGMQEELGRGDSVTNLHVNMGDVVFLLMNTSEVSFHGQKQPKSLKIHETVRESDEKESLGDVDMVEPEISLSNGGKSPDLAPKGIDCGGGLSAKDYDTVEETMHNEVVTTSGEMNSVKFSHSVKDNEGVDSEKDHAGALWDVFRRQDVSKLNEYLKIHWNEFQSHVRLSGNSSGEHPLHDQDVFLNRDHLRKLKEEFNVEPWTFEQRVHEAVFIPAGCPFQMRNLQSSVQLCLDFLSPDSLGESVSLAQDIRRLPNDHGAKLQMLEVGKMSLYAASSAIKEIQKLTLDPIVGPELAFEDRNLTALVSENIEKMVKRRQITCI